jgi:DNA polymerase I
MLLVGDYDQVEYVAAAHIAGDEQLLSPLREALGRGEKFDFHAITARMILESIHDREVTDEEVAEFRSRAKTVNFAVLYGTSYDSLAKRLSVTPTTALGYIDALFANAPKLRRWSSQQKAKAKRGENVARTVLGRARLADLKRRGGEWRANASQMLNHPVQGSCAEGYKIAAAMLYERREEFAGNPLLVNMVHDEFVLEVDDGANEDVELMHSIMIEGMLEALGPKAPISAGVKSVYRWQK